MTHGHQNLPIYRLNDQLYTNIQNTKTQPMYPQHNIYTNKCMDICIPSCECRPFPMPPSAKIKNSAYRHKQARFGAIYIITDSGQKSGAVNLSSLCTSQQISHKSKNKFHNWYHHCSDQNVEVDFPMTAVIQRLLFAGQRNLVHITKHRSMDLVLNKQGKINRLGGITMCQSDRSRRKEQQVAE